MKSALSVCVLLALCSTIRAQYNPVFTEDFESNSHQWKTNEKRPYIHISSGKYLLYNDGGNQPVFSLVEIPMDYKNACQITSLIEQSFTPEPHDARYGILFGATDEKNGYGFILGKYGDYALVKFANGKKTEITSGYCHVKDYSQTFYTGNRLKIILGKARWHLFINDSLLYTCAPLSLSGTKTGFYVSAHTGLIAREITISEASHSSAACPVLFTQDEFNATLNKAYCSAPSNFENYLGEFDDAIDDFEFWNVVGIDLKGAYEIYMASGGSSQDFRVGKDFIIGFICADSSDIDQGLILYDQLISSISHFSPECGTIDYKDKLVNLSMTLIESMQWEGEVPDTASGTVPVLIELDYIYSQQKYYTYIHINERL